MSDGTYRYGPALRRHISGHLDGFSRLPRPREGLKRAAVAITVVDDGNGGGAFLLTRRASHLRSHAGQMALPGGRLDDGEVEVEAALRELAEEVGLIVAADDVLGLLDDYPTRSGYLITPVVVWAGTDAELSPNPDEVAELYRIPLTELDRPDSPELLEIPESDRPVIRLPFGDNKLHAPSAAVVYQFREIGLHGRATRVDHFEQPVWAWR